MLNKVAWEIGLDIEVKFVPNKDDKPAKSIMAGCLEAVIGAIFESAGYETARAFVNEVLLDKHIFEVLESVFDPITDLHELVAIERWEPKVSKSVIEVGEDRVFRHVIELNGMIATGDGLSRKWAEWEASRKMLSQIKERMIEEKKNRSTPST